MILVFDWLKHKKSPLKPLWLCQMEQYFIGHVGSVYARSFTKFCHFSNRTNTWAIWKIYVTLKNCLPTQMIHIGLVASMQAPV